jgi:hypothetical protein
VEGADEIPRTFQRTKGDALRLEIAMKFDVLARTRVATYSFELEPISVERIDVLESRGRDLRDEVKVLKASGNAAVAELQEAAEKHQLQLVDLQGTIKDLESLTIQANATRKIAGNIICWSAGEHSNGRDGIIRNLPSGTYKVTVVVNYAASDYGRTLQLKNMDRVIQLVYCTYINRHYTSGVLARTVRVVEGDQLSVVCTADKVDCDDGCYLTLT